MKLSLTPLLILLFIAIRSFAQETKEVVDRSGDKYTPVKTTYQVLKDNRDIKHGPYKLEFGNITVTGFYKMNKKDNAWERVTSKGIIVSKKMYSEGKKTGTWQFYKYDGAFDWQYDFEKDSFINKPQELVIYSYQSANDEWIQGNADRAPKWLTGGFEWQSFLNRTLRYPQDAIDKNKMGKSVIEITVDENGDAIDYRIAETPWPSLGAEVLRVVKIFQPEFIPAEKDGKKVKSKVGVTITNRLER